MLTPEQIETIESNLRERLSAKKCAHIHSVRRLAKTLAEAYGADTDKAAAAALLHDYVKSQSPDELVDTAANLGFELDPFDLKYPKILHSIVGSEVARHEFGIDDPDVLSAIRQHTTGDVRMGLLAKILYVADYAEPLRSHELAPAIRQHALSISLDEACLMAVDGSICHLIQKQALIHPRTIAAHNGLLEELQRKKYTDHEESRSTRREGGKVLQKA